MAEHKRTAMQEGLIRRDNYSVESVRRRREEWTRWKKYHSRAAGLRLPRDGRVWFDRDGSFRRYLNREWWLDEHQQTPFPTGSEKRQDAGGEAVTESEYQAEAAGWGGFEKELQMRRQDNNSRDEWEERNGL